MEINVNVTLGVTPEASELVRRMTFAVIAATGLTKALEDGGEESRASDQTREEKPAESPAEAPAASEKPKASRSRKKAEPAPAPEPEPEKPKEMPAAEEPMPMDPEPEKPATAGAPAEISNDDLIRLTKQYGADKAKGFLTANGLKKLSDMSQEKRREFKNAMEDPNYVPF